MDIKKPRLNALDNISIPLWDKYTSIEEFLNKLEIKYSFNQTNRVIIKPMANHEYNLKNTIDSITSISNNQYVNLLNEVSVPVIGDTKEVQNLENKLMERNESITYDTNNTNKEIIQNATDNNNSDLSDSSSQCQQNMEHVKSTMSFNNLISLKSNEISKSSSEHNVVCTSTTNSNLTFDEIFSGNKSDFMLRPSTILLNHCGFENNEALSNSNSICLTNKFKLKIDDIFALNATENVFEQPNFLLKHNDLNKKYEEISGSKSNVLISDVNLLDNVTSLKSMNSLSQTPSTKEDNNDEKDTRHSFSNIFLKLDKDILVDSKPNILQNDDSLKLEKKPSEQNVDDKKDVILSSSKTNASRNEMCLNTLLELPTTKIEETDKNKDVSFSLDANISSKMDILNNNINTSAPKTLLQEPSPVLESSDSGKKEVKLSSSNMILSEKEIDLKLENITCTPKSVQTPISILKHSSKTSVFEKQSQFKLNTRTSLKKSETLLHQAEPIQKYYDCDKQFKRKNLEIDSKKSKYETKLKTISKNDKKSKDFNKENILTHSQFGSQTKSREVFEKCVTSNSKCSILRDEIQLLQMDFCFDNIRPRSYSMTSSRSKSSVSDSLKMDKDSCVTNNINKSIKRSTSTPSKSKSNLLRTDSKTRCRSKSPDTLRKNYKSKSNISDIEVHVSKSQRTVDINKSSKRIVSKHDDFDTKIVTSVKSKQNDLGKKQYLKSDTDTSTSISESKEELNEYLQKYGNNETDELLNPLNLKILEDKKLKELILQRNVGKIKTYLSKRGDLSAILKKKGLTQSKKNQFKSILKNPSVQQICKKKSKTPENQKKKEFNIKTILEQQKTKELKKSETKTPNSALKIQTINPIDSSATKYIQIVRKPKEVEIEVPAISKTVAVLQEFEKEERMERENVKKQLEKKLLKLSGLIKEFKDEKIQNLVQLDEDDDFQKKMKPKQEPRIIKHVTFQLDQNTTQKTEINKYDLFNKIQNTLDRVSSKLEKNTIIIQRIAELKEAIKNLIGISDTNIVLPKFQKKTQLECSTTSHADKTSKNVNSSLKLLKNLNEVIRDVKDNPESAMKKLKIIELSLKSDHDLIFKNSIKNTDEYRQSKEMRMERKDSDKKQKSLKTKLKKHNIIPQVDSKYVNIQSKPSKGKLKNKLKRKHSAISVKTSIKPSAKSVVQTIEPRNVYPVVETPRQLTPCKIFRPVRPKNFPESILMTNITLEDVQPFQSEYPRKDDLAKIDVKETYLYKLVNNVFSDSLEPLIRCPRKHHESTARLYKENQKRLLKYNNCVSKLKIINEKVNQEKSREKSENKKLSKRLKWTKESAPPNDGGSDYSKLKASPPIVTLDKMTDRRLEEIMQDVNIRKLLTPRNKTSPVLDDVTPTSTARVKSAKRKKDLKKNKKKQMKKSSSTVHTQKVVKII